MRNKSNIVNFEFQSNLNERHHFHHNIEIEYVLEGSAELKIEEESFILKEGDFVLINANKRHGITTKTDNTLVASFSIDYTMLVEYMNHEQILFWCNTVTDKNESYEILRKNLDQILNQYFEQSEEGALYLNSLYFEMLYILTSYFMIKADDCRVHNIGGNDDVRVYEIQTYVQSNYQNQISLNDLANKLYLSTAYLSKYIKKRFGLSFMEYLNNIRLFHAVDDLIYTDKKIIRVALDNGFPSTASFNRAFREYFSVTPSEYRQQIKNEENVPDEKEENAEQLQEKVQQFLSKKVIEDKQVVVDSATILEFEVNKTTTLKRNWNEVMNFGDAYSILRSDVQQHILMAKKEMDFQYIRISNLFTESCYNKNGRDSKYLNLNKLDRVLDFLIDHDIHPFIELGFKPLEINNGVDNTLMKQEHEIVFDSLEAYEKAFEEFAVHIVNRYGVKEVEKWRFELWQDPRMKIDESSGWYYRNFEVGYEVLKKVSKEIKVGGPGLVLGSENHRYKNIFGIWKRRGIIPDFLSVYSYGHITIKEGEMYFAKKSIDSQFILNQVKILRDTLKEMNFPVEEIYITEWNSTFSNRNPLNDSCAHAAYIMKNCIEMVGEVDSMAYWQGSDLYTEYYDSDGILTGDCGTISRDGIKKPSFFAFHFLSFLKDSLIAKNENAIVTTDNRDNYCIAAHNNKRLNYKYAMKEEHMISYLEQNSLFEDLKPIFMEYNLKNVKNGDYVCKVYYVNEKNGSVQNIWEQMEYSKNLSYGEIDYLKRCAMPRVEIKHIHVEDGILRLEMRMEPHEIRVLDINYVYN